MIKVIPAINYSEEDDPAIKQFQKELLKKQIAAADNEAAIADKKAKFYDFQMQANGFNV